MNPSLFDRVAALKGADDAARLAFLNEEHHVYHPRLLAIENKLHAIVDSPNPSTMHRAFFARSFNGKSTITKHFASLYPADLNPLGDAAIVKVVRISMPGEASVREFAVRILEAVHEPFNPRWATSHLMSCAYGVLKSLKVRLLIIDEFQDVANGTSRTTQTLKNVVKSIGEDCGCGVALFGTPEGIDIVEGEPQLQRRFEHEAIDPWVVDEDTATLLHNMEAMLPLRKVSNIAADASLMQTIVNQGDGVIGHMRRVVYSAARAAIHTGREVIDAGSIAASDWIPLSKRGGTTWGRVDPDEPPEK